MINKTFNPSINYGVTNYIYDPDSGNNNQPPANGVWNTVSRWQGPAPITLTQTGPNLFQSNINTEVLPFRTVVGGGPHNVLAYTNPASTIQRSFGDSLNLSWAQSIDYFYTGSSGVAQLNAYAYFRDPDGMFFAILFASYDNRFTNYTPSIGFDTQTFFASTPIGNTKYCASNNSMTSDGLGFINYSLTFTKTHFATALADLVASGATVNWLCPADWRIHEVGIIHEVYQFNDPTVQLQSNVTFSSLNVTNTTLDYPTTINFSQGYPSFNTMINGIQCTPDAYDIQSTQANGYNTSAGIMTVKFDWRSHRYWEFNPGAHCAFILRASENHIRGNVITDPGTGKHVRGNQGTGLLFGNLSGYSNPITGHVGNPIHPSTIIETWYQPNGYGNDLLPGSWGNMVLQDDVTYQTEINAKIDSNGKSFVSYKLVSGGITIFDCPPIADNNTYYDPTNTGLIIGQVFASGNNDPADPWSINLSNLSVTWSAYNPTYAIVPNVTFVNEGGSVTWTVTTTNVPDGTVLYWTNSGTTNGADFSDFVISPSDGLSGSFVITGNSGTFTRTTAIDRLTEGLETIIMNIRTGGGGGTIVATAATVYVNDTSIGGGGATYSISPNVTRIDEGGTVTWTIATTNIPDGTVLYWTNSGTTNGADFSDFVISPSDGLSGSFVVTNNVGTFTRTLANDLVTEGEETIIMNVRVGSALGTIVATAATVYVNDTSRTPSVPAYSVAPDKDRVVEGGTVTWNIITANVADGTTLYWTNSGTTENADFTDYIPGGPNRMLGSFVVTNNAGSFGRTLVNDAKLEGTETIAIDIRTGSTNGPVVATSSIVYVVDTSIPVPKTYTVTPNKINVNEGDIVVWRVSTTGLEDGTVLYWTSQGTTDSADFDDGLGLSGSVVITNNGGVFSRSIVRDKKTEGIETIILQIRIRSIVGPIVCISPTVYVNDTSTGPPIYNVSPNIATVKEGDTVIYTVHTENVPINTTLFWTIDGIGTTTDERDFSDLVSSGTVVITSVDLGIGKAHGRITRRLLKDNLKEGTETMVLRVRIGSTEGPIVATASPVRVIDTSRNPIISWASTGSLGTLLPGQISELYVKAVFNTTTVYPKYTIFDGVLPSGLIMERDGTVSGQVKVDTSRTSFTETSTFVVSVTDPNNRTLLKGQFSITVKQTESTDRTDIYCRPFLTQDKRNDFRNFIRNESVFPANMLYRTFDPNFGRQEDLTVYIDFGVEKLTYEKYANIASTNFYKRQLSIGKIKTAVAKNPNGTVKYEFIYLDVIDKHVNSSKISMPLEFTFNGVTYYPPSIPNMRSIIAEKSTISTVRYPSFTNYVQQGSAIKLGYIPFIPLCYSLPGKSSTIIRKITESGFKFNTINFELDRLVIKDIQNEYGAKYLLLSRDTKLA